jgi:HPt (histidine-containing phosphotransfer) domain-containing protein
MRSLLVEINDPETVHAIAEVAGLKGTTPEAAALELLETALLAQKLFEQVVEPIARGFDESGMSEEELDDLVKQSLTAIREDRHRNT